MEEKIYWIALQQTPGLGARRVLQLVKSFGSPRTVWTLPEKDLYSLKGFGDVLDSFVNWRRQVRPERIMEKLNAAGINVVTIEEEQYPLDLKRIYDPPPLLYWRGSCFPGKELKIAIVGTRRATPYGIKVANEIAEGLACAGVGIVSGAARGIDAAAHRGCIKGKGITWGVLGCGIDIIYPREHRELYHDIMDNGAIISEYPPGTPPAAGNFPARNRIISGMTAGTLVVEAASRSGALITANLALEQNRDVFAVPGPITSRYSEGPNELIKEGAKVVTCISDIMEEYDKQARTLWDNFKGDEHLELLLTPVEEQLLQCISIIPTHIDTIMTGTNLQPGEINTALLQLEMKKYIKRLPGGFYLRC